MNIINNNLPNKFFPTLLEKTQTILTEKNQIIILIASIAFTALAAIYLLRHCFKPSSTASDGSVFKGSFDSEYTGTGTRSFVKYSDINRIYEGPIYQGTVYEGTFINGKLNGQGAIYYKDEDQTVYRGDFENDVLKKGTIRKGEIITEVK